MQVALLVFSSRHVQQRHLLVVLLAACLSGARAQTTGTYLRLTTGTGSYDDGRDVYVTLTSADGTVKASYVAIDTPAKGVSTYWQPSGANPWEHGDRLRLQYTSRDGWRGSMYLEGARLAGPGNPFEMDSPCCTLREWTIEFPPQSPPPRTNMAPIIGAIGGSIVLLIFVGMVCLIRNMSNDNAKAAPKSTSTTSSSVSNEPMQGTAVGTVPVVQSMPLAAAAVSTTVVGPPTSIEPMAVQKLKELKELLDMGVITKKDFEAKKQEILNPKTGSAVPAVVMANEPEKLEEEIDMV